MTKHNVFYHACPQTVEAPVDQLSNEQAAQYVCSVLVNLEPLSLGGHLYALKELEQRGRPATLDDLDDNSEYWSLLAAYQTKIVIKALEMFNIG